MCDGMDSAHLETVLGPDTPLPLPSLRLLVPPLQLMTAGMWRVVHRLEVRHYWEVAQFVSLVMDMVPELLLDKHWTQLCTGLRAKYILELFRAEQPVDPEQVTTLLDTVTRPRLPSARQEEVEEANFVELVHTMLKDPEVKQHFFTEVFPVAYGADYDQDLLTLFEELLYRLAQLLPIPDLGQTVTWLGSGSSLLEECDHSISSTHLRGLLDHHRQLGLLEQHVPPSSMGDRILSSLAGPPPATPPGPSGLGDRPPLASLAEVVVVTDYAEVELGTTAHPQEGEEYIEEVVMETEEEGPPEEDPAPPASPARPHRCPDCHKRFCFASSLSAHRVVHTGERPHRCSTCGRRFSFRQSLDRHKHTHEAPTPRGEPQTTPQGEPQTTPRGEHTPEATPHTTPQGEQAPDTTPGPGGRGDPVVDDGVEPGVLAPALVEQVVSLVAVRTSGRKRRPTMKVEVINLQKRLERGRGGVSVWAEPKRRKRGGATVPFNSSEHSYGSSEVLLGSAAAEDQNTEGGSSQVLSGVDEDRVLRAPPPGTGCHGDDLPAVVLQDGRFGCPDCDKSFRFRSLLASHRRVHTGEQPFLCSQCGRRFSFKQSLERHRQTHLAAQRDHQTRDTSGGFLCSRCGRSFTAKSALVRHAKTHGEETPMGTSSSTHSHGDQEVQEEEQQQLHTCDCGKSFSYRAALVAHQRVHREERPYACAQCSKRFLYRGGLQSHMKTHSEDTPFACSFCGKRFKRERNMKKHERCHTREDVFRCSQCDKSFVYKATLTRHELTHSGQRPFLCSACGKGFYSHAELLKHERFHTGHKPFQCPFCGKRFTQSCYLTIHVRYHTGARPYACTECDKSFLSANRLKRHQRTHTGEKPYLCTECGRGFRQSYHLKVHLRTHAYV